MCKYKGIHNHPMLETKLGLDKDHVIVDKEDYEYIHHCRDMDCNQGPCVVPSLLLKKIRRNMAEICTLLEGKERKYKKQKASKKLEVDISKITEKIIKSIEKKIKEYEQPKYLLTLPEGNIKLMSEDKKAVICPVCNGKGTVASDFYDTGYNWEITWNHFDSITGTADCTCVPTMNYPIECRSCDGKGYIVIPDDDKKIKYKCPNCSDIYSEQSYNGNCIKCKESYNKDVKMLPLRV